MAICLGWRLSFAFYKMLVSSASYKMKSFKLFFDRYYQGKNQEAFVQMVKNFTGQRKNLSLFKEQIYQIYDFLQSTSDPEKWLEEHFLKG